MNPHVLMIPPHSREAEHSTLGALLLDREAIHHVGDLVADAFYTAFHADAFRAIQVLAAEGKPHDVITVGEHMKCSGEYDSDVIADLNTITRVESRQK